jgi:N-acetylmuramoyl-L-alanine amidase
LKLGENFVPISHRPRFIDGKLRVSETFILRQLAPLLAEPLQYRNHNPSETVVAEDPLDRLFAFLLRRKPQTDDRSQWAVALDPGHGGMDSGVIAVVQAGADVLLSLHAQGFFSPEPHGVMLFIQPETERDLPQGMTGENASRQLAEALRESLVSAGFIVAGVMEQPVLPLGRGDLPRVLVEMGSLSHSGDLARSRKSNI